jgi:hypothetical protein
MPDSPSTDLPQSGAIPKPEPGHSSIKLYTNAHIWAGLAPRLRELGYDALSTEEAGHKPLSDDDQLAFAASQDRAILTFNIKDFVPLAEGWFYAGRSHWGIIVAQETPKGELLRRTLNLLQTLSAEELRDTVRFLEEFK